MDSYPVEVGERLKSSRERAALTQRELAEKVGVTSTTVSRWERGATEPPRNKLRRAARELNVGWRWLLSGGQDGHDEPEEDLLQALREELWFVRQSVEANADEIDRTQSQLERLAGLVNDRDDLTRRRFDDLEARVGRLAAAR